MRHAIESVMIAGEEVEILIVNDGSKDGTAAIADEYQAKYPTICKAVHKENGGHGDAVMLGLQNATGLYFKVVDSDDWLDADAFPKVMDALRTLQTPETQVDLFLANYIYDKVDAEHKHVVKYTNALPVGKTFTWDDVGHFRVGQYILMHAAIYRTELLRTCGLSLPKHTFYVDNIYVYQPLPSVKKMYYLDVDLYHYFIGREDQSVHEEVMIRRIDQQLKVNRIMLGIDLTKVEHPKTRAYMRNYMEIINAISSTLLVRSGTEENLKKRDQLWADMKEQYPNNYRILHGRIIGKACTFKTKFGKWLLMKAYDISQKVVGFN